MLVGWHLDGVVRHWWSNRGYLTHFMLVFHYAEDASVGQDREVPVTRDQVHGTGPGEALPEKGGWLGSSVGNHGESHVRLCRDTKNPARCCSTIGAPNS